MKRREKRKIDFAIMMLSGVLMSFSAYCWVNVLLQGTAVLFPDAFAVEQTNQSEVLPETEKETQEQGEEDELPLQTSAQEKESGPREKHLLQQLDDFMGRIDNFWYVNVCRENEWSGLDSAVTYLATGEISSSQVLLGKEGWLFYKSVFDNDPIGDYDGTKQFTQDEMKMIGESVLRVQTALEERGIRFTVLLCPNKENVYAAYMPENYAYAEKSRTDFLAAYLEDEGVSVVNLKENMIRHSGGYPLYYLYDTHWNQLGGYVGTETLLRSWGIGYPQLKERKILSKNLWDCENRECNDDLAKLSRLQFVFDDEREYVVEGTHSIDWRGIESEEYICFENPDAVCEERVLLIGDSFRRAMLPSLCEEFREVYVIHRENFEAGMLNEIHPDDVIAEYVERYSGDMKEMENLFYDSGS